MDVLSFAPKNYFGSNMYLLFSDNECAVIDPSVDYDTVRSRIDGENIKLKYIIVTHSHFDHILKIDSWVQNCPEAIVIVGKEDAPALSDSYLNCYSLYFANEKGYFGSYHTVSGGDVLTLGKTTLKILETPGHTPGSISVLESDKVFVGDLVFADGGVGRCDFPGGDYTKLIASIKKITALPQHTAMYSGHGRETDVEEIKINFI